MTARADLFAIGVGTETDNAPIIEGAKRATLEVRALPPTVDVFWIGPHRLQTFHDVVNDRAVYLWGCVSHPEKLRGDDLLRWCGQVQDRHPESLRQMLGNFVLIIDDRRHQRVSFVSDVLALRPWFVGSAGGRLVAGSDVLRLCETGLTSGNVNYDAIACWLLYNFDCTGGSVAQDYRRLPLGAIWTFDAAGRQLDDHRYAPVRYMRNVVPHEQLVDELHSLMRRKFNELMDGLALTEVSLPLSGGYDSRYLCALAAQRGAPRQHAVTVATSPTELSPARQVAEALNLPLRVVGSNRHILDLFDDPFAFGGDGFPIARHLSAAVARMNPGMCLLSGFLGDVLMRAPVNAAVMRFAALDDEEHTNAEYADATHKRFRVWTNRLDLLRDSIAPHAMERARAHLLRWIEAGRIAGRPLAFTGLNTRLRLYFGGVFLGHLETAETILPFCNWELIEYSTQRVGSFRTENYEVLFKKYFPRLSHIPHDSRIKSSTNGAVPDNSRRRTRHLRAWSADLLRSLMNGQAGTSAIVPRKLLSRLPRGLLADLSAQNETMFLHKIQLFERRVRRANLRLDWSRM